MPGLELAVALVGGIVGGFAAGFIWVAQGQYFAHSAKLYAAEVGVAEPNPTPTPNPTPHPIPNPITLPLTLEP
eukprot:scaffold127695_cov47-Phaeocystis_antarctica.AAC.3